jgi:hypothetical protein
MSTNKTLKTVIIVRFKMKISQKINERARESYFSPSIKNQDAKEIAQYTLDRVDNAEVYYNKSTLIEKGHKAILETDKISPEEKAVAELGQQFSENSRLYETWIPVYYQKPVMAAIAGGVPGSIGAALAHATTTTACSGLKKSNVNWVLQQGYEKIMNDPETSDKDKRLSAFGHSLTKTQTLSISSINANLKVLKAIRNQTEKPLTNTIAELSLNYKHRQKVGDVGKALDTGFKAIWQNPDATNEEKTLARMGFDAGANAQNKFIAVGEKVEIMKVLEKETTPEEKREAIEALKSEEEKELEKFINEAQDESSDIAENKLDKILSQDDDKVKIGGTLVSKRKNGPPPMEAWLLRCLTGDKDK